MAQYVRRLKEFDTDTVLPLAERGPGTYEIDLLIEGNSVLSSVFVEYADPGASVTVSWHDHTTGEDVGEEFALQEHPTLTSGPQSSRLTVTRIHNKPTARCVVAGGTVKFSLYITVVAAFASDLDSALQYEGEDVLFTRDKGMPIAVLDALTQEWQFLRSSNGRLQVDVPNVIQTTQQTINFRRYGNANAVVPAATPTIIDYTVPANAQLFLLGGRGTSNTWTKWEGQIFGELLPVFGGRNSYSSPDWELHLGGPLILAPNSRIIVTAENRSPYDDLANIEFWLYGALEAL